MLFQDKFRFIVEETPIHFTTEEAEAVFAGHGKRLGKRDLRKPNRLNVKHCLRPCDQVENIFATNPKALQARAKAKAKMFNPIAGSEAAFGIEAVKFPEGLFSPTDFRASRMRASAISVVKNGTTTR